MSESENIYEFPLYCKTWPGSKRLIRSFRLSLADSALAEEIADVFYDYGEAPGSSALANHGRLGVRKLIRVPRESDYELPAGESPENMLWVRVRLVCLDDNEALLGQRYITVPGVKSIEALEMALAGMVYEIGGVLVLCRDGVFREADDFEIDRIDTYRV